jgi:DNA ligase-1
MDSLALVCEDIASHSSRLKKIGLLADYLKQLPDSSFELAVQFLSAGPIVRETTHATLFGPSVDTRLSLGPSLMRDAVKLATGWDSETLRICYREVGDTGETIGLLLKPPAAAEPLSLSRANDYYHALHRTPNAAQKVKLLASLYQKHSPLAIKYFLKVITGNLRIGLLEKMLEEAVAIACSVTIDAVRQAQNRAGNLTLVAAAARAGKLHEIQAALFHPMDFMLAKPLDPLTDLPSPASYAVEDKYDGIRSHVHLDDGRIRIYSRGMEDITAAFPEIVNAFAPLHSNAICDGEILAWRDDRPLSFNLLQQRISRKRVKVSLAHQIPVIFMAYDLLFDNGNLLLDLPLVERRHRLENLLNRAASPIVKLSPQHHAATHAELEALFTASRERGNEGLVLKRLGSTYEPGRRTGAWLKWKRPYASLDVVITAAEQGSGRRATLLSDYTFAVRSGDQFVNVGKAYSGLTDPEVRELTRILRSASIDRFGKVTLVRPEVVLEVTFDGIQQSPRHKSGYALRFPRISRWRRDKNPQEADDLAHVEALYRQSLR